MRATGNRFSTRPSGFTLIEVLVVVAIIALLCAVLLPSLAQARKRAQNVLCQGRLGEWGKVWAMDVQANKDRFSPGAFDDADDDWPRGEWITRLRSLYITKTEILRCPLATTRLPGQKHGGTFNTYYMPLGGNQSQGGGEEPSYGVNVWVHDPPPETTLIQKRPTAYNWRRPSAAKYPNRVPLFGDSMWRGGGPMDGLEGESSSATPNKIMPPNFDGEWSGANYEIKHFCINRHNGYVHHLFMDWSVRRVGLRGLWRLKWHRKFNTANFWTSAGGRPLRDWPAWLRRHSDR